MAVNQQTVLIVAIIVMIFIVLVLIGASIYQSLEDVSFRDSLFFQVSAATTIGSTEFAPKTSSGTWFQIFYSIILVVYFLGSFFFIDRLPFRA